MGSEINTGGTTAAPGLEGEPPLARPRDDVSWVVVRDRLLSAMAYARRTNDLASYELLGALWRSIFPGMEPHPSDIPEYGDSADWMPTPRDQRQDSTPETSGRGLIEMYTNQRFGGHGR